MSLRVLSAGLLTTVQDLGRRGHQCEGIPESGAMDRIALRLANVLVGNPESAAALEITLAGPTLLFETASLAALAGADLGAVVDGQRVPPWRAMLVPAGATMSFGAPLSGCRAYLAVAGGIDTPVVLGSRSTYLRAAFGGLEGRALRAGDVVGAGAASPLSTRIAASLAHGGGAVSVAAWGAGPSLRPPYSSSPFIRLITGAHAKMLTRASSDQLFRAEFRVSPQSDRMGYRLEGPTLELEEPRDLLSEAVAFGTVQLPSGGSPIVLMADRQTTGGYPRIGEVATVDLPLLAQLKPGDRLRFRSISLDGAQEVYLAREAELAQASRAIALRHP